MPLLVSHLLATHGCLLQQDVHLKLRRGVKIALAAFRGKNSQNTATTVMVTVLIDNRYTVCYAFPCL